MQAAKDDNSQKIKVRLLDRNDSLENVTELLHRAYANHAADGLRYMAHSQSSTQTRQRIRNAECYVVEKNSCLVGTFCLWAPEHTGGLPWYDRPHVAKAAQIAVDATLQGQGIGRTIFHFMERRASEMGATELALDTSQKAVGLVATYIRRGYRLVQYTYWPNTNYRSVVLSKQLEGGQFDPLRYRIRLMHSLRAWFRQSRNRISSFIRPQFGETDASN